MFRKTLAVAIISTVCVSPVIATEALYQAMTAAMGEAIEDPRYLDVLENYGMPAPDFKNDKSLVNSTDYKYPDTVEDAKNWGLWISKAFKDVEADIFTEPGLFWIRPDGKLYLADISNMPWARPDLKNLLSKVPYALEHSYPARGTYAA